MLAESDDMITELDELHGLERGMLRLGLLPLGSATLFAPLFAIFRSRYPGIEIGLVELAASGWKRCCWLGRSPAAGLGRVRLAGHPGRAFDGAARPRSSAGRCTQYRPLHAGREHPLILSESGFALNKIILDVCRRHGCHLNVAARSGQIDFIVELASAGLDIAFLPRMIAEQRRHAAVRPDAAR